MSQETLAALARALETDKLLREKFLSANSLEERVAVAAVEGHDVSVGDLETWFGLGKEGELSEADLTAVAGGMGGTVSAIGCQTQLSCAVGACLMKGIQTLDPIACAARQGGRTRPSETGMC